MNLQRCVLSIAFAICSLIHSNHSELEISFHNKSILIRLDLPDPTTPTVESTPDAISTTKLPHNTFLFNGTKYMFHTESKEGWFVASRSCWHKGMRLIEIYSAEENNWIANKIKELGYGNDDFWTGGKYSVPWPQFKWNDANKIDFVNWADGEPAKGNEERYNTVHYIALTAATDFKWSNVVDDVFYDVKNYFLCKEIVKVDSDPLPHNTFMFTGKKYHFNTVTKMSAFDASSYCYGKRMTLVAILSMEENDWIVNRIKELGFASDDFWTGGFLYSSYPRSFDWDTYADNVTFTDWADGQPRQVDDRLWNCMVLTASADFKWSLRLCQFDLNYVVCKERFPDSGLPPTLL